MSKNIDIIKNILELRKEIYSVYYNIINLFCVDFADLDVDFACAITVSESIADAQNSQIQFNILWRCIL